MVGDAVEHEAVRRPPRTDLLGEQVSSGEGATGRGLRSPAWSNYSSPTPGLAHASYARFGRQLFKGPSSAWAYLLGEQPAHVDPAEHLVRLGLGLGLGLGFGLGLG